MKNIHFLAQKESEKFFLHESFINIEMMKLCVFISCFTLSFITRTWNSTLRLYSFCLRIFLGKFSFTTLLISKCFIIPACRPDSAFLYRIYNKNSRKSLRKLMKNLPCGKKKFLIFYNTNFCHYWDRSKFSWILGMWLNF